MMKRSATALMATLGFAMMVGCTSLGPYPDMMATAKADIDPNPVHKKATSSPTSTDSTKQAQPEAANKPSTRLMIYKAQVSIIVENVERALGALAQEAKKTGGHVQSLDTNAILVRVPAVSLDDYLAKTSELGAIISKKLTGQDVTDTMRDLEIRLKTAMGMHKRLLALFERAQKVEDMLKIEKELQRVVEIIEQIKGRTQALSHDVAYSTVRIEVNSPLPQKRINQEIPFTWVRTLANDMVSGRVSERWTSLKGDHVAFKLPTGFAMYHQAGYVTRATSATDVLIKVSRHTNFEGADLDFWTRLATKNLRISRCLSLGKGESVQIYNGRKKGRMIQGTRTVGSVKKRYLLVLAATDDHVYSYEVWGSASEFDTVADAIRTSVKTWRPGRFLE